MSIQHKDIPEGNLHEPKGISLASVDQVYVADGLGSGVWKKVDTTITPYMELTFTGTTTTNGLVPLTFTTTTPNSTIGISNNSNRLTVTKSGIYIINLDTTFTLPQNAAEQVNVNIRLNKTLASQSIVGTFFKVLTLLEKSNATATMGDVRSVVVGLNVGDELGFWLTRVGVQPFSASISGIINICRIGS